jgi:hypothetical protein
VKVIFAVVMLHQCQRSRKHSPGLKDFWINIVRFLKAII